MFKRPTSALVAALAYAASLAWLPFLQPSGVTLVLAHVFVLQSAHGVVELVKSLLLAALLKLLSCVPLGCLCVLGFPDQPERRERLRRVVLPAAGLSLLLGYAAAAVQTRAFMPSPWNLLLTWTGVLSGVWLWLSVRRGPRARRLIVPKLAAAALAGCALLGLLAWLAIAAEPSVPSRAAVSSDQHRELVSLFRGRDPRKIPAGETRAVTVRNDQLDALVAWGGTLLKARTQVTLRDGGVAGEISVPLPRQRGWLNVRAAGQLTLAQGQLDLADLELHVGHVWVPSFLLGLAAQGTLAALRADRDAGAVLAVLRELSLSPSSATLTYGGLHVRSGLAARLIWGEQARAELGEPVLAQVQQLVETLERVPAGDERFLAALRTVFGRAREQTGSTSSAVSQNRAALVALGIVMGHPKLVRVVGERLDAALFARSDAVRAGTTLRGRNDWVRHFSVSAALTVLSAVAPSDAVGLLKEELDADGGSGFSFADLLADRAGTTLAELSTRSEESARTLATQLAQLSTVDAVFPAAEGLPEGISKADFETVYGGMGGDKFKALSAELEQRLTTCTLLTP